MTGGVEECAEDPDCGGATYNACMTAYEASLGRGNFQDGTSIWVDKSGVEVKVCRKQNQKYILFPLLCS